MPDLDKVESLFHDALALPLDVDRSTWLAAECGEDSDLFEEVSTLLVARAQKADAAKDAQPPIPSASFGAYRALRLIGRGGMSAVYLAERADGLFQQTTALKVMAGYLADREFFRRFDAERQFLAALNHPNIARLLDGGVSSGGDPFLVTEYVDGQNIDRYCDERKLGVEARLRIFLQVSEAVDYAHRKLIVHRDLKPANILVNQEGEVKLLDFGTASLAEPSKSNPTVTRFRMLTPRYASPEQLRGERVNIPTDVFSLGVVLYELLAGAWPFGDPNSRLRELDRTTGDISAQPPSTAITEKAARNRSVTREQLSRVLKGDLSAIVLKALESEPSHRYESVRALVTDLRNFLAERPVAAHPQTFLYRAVKLFRRRWLPSAGRESIEVESSIEEPFAVRRRRVWPYGAAGLVCIGAAILAWRAVPRHETAGSIAVLPFTNLSSDPADQYFSDGLTDEITDSLARLQSLRVIARSSVFQFKGKTVDVREVGRLLKVASVVEGSVKRSGDRIKVIAHLERVSDGSLLWSNTYERRASDLFSVQSELAAGIAGGLRVAAGLPKAGHVPKPEAFDMALKGRYDLQQMTPESISSAETEFQRAIDLDPQYGAAYLGLAFAKYDQLIARGSAYRTDAERKDAEQLLRKSLEMDPDSSEAHAMLAGLVMQYGWEWGLAERELHSATDGHTSSLAEEFYAFLLIFRGRYAEAEPHIRRALELNPFSVSTMDNVALFRYLEGHFAEARDISQHAAAEHPAVLQPQGMIGLTYIEEGHPELALPVIRPLIPRFPPARVWEAMAHARAGRREEALRLIRPFEEKYPHPGVPLDWLARVYAFLGDEPNTVKWLGRSADAHEFQAMSLGIDPVYAAMRNSPGFRAIEKRMGLDH